MATNWNDYQEEAANFFRSIGLEATTNVRVRGVRTHHDIDVLVKSHHAGFDITWLIECKFWKESVSKLHVLALREIVADIGADRGILLSESGFQSGAVEAANLTNVHVTSIAELSLSAKQDIYAMRLRELYNRLETCETRYWEIPKSLRIEHGLRAEFMAEGYSGAEVIQVCKLSLSYAFRGVYPFKCDIIQALYIKEIPEVFFNHEHVAKVMEILISQLEGKLDDYHLKTAGDLPKP